MHVPWLGVERAVNSLAGLNVMSKISRTRWSEEERVFVKEQWLKGSDRRKVLQLVNQKFGNNRTLQGLSNLCTRLNLPTNHKVRRILEKSPEAENLHRQALALPSLNQLRAGHARKRNPKQKVRTCILCRSPFDSQHAGNRICSSCKKSNEFNCVL